MALGIARKVAGSDELARAVELLLKDANQRHNIGEAAKQFVQQNRGARDKVVALVDALL